jgi:hypothetical protein
VSKLIQLLVFREFVNQLTQPKSGHIITSILNPGGVNTDVVRDDMGAIKGLFIRGIQATLMRTAEVGGRTLAHAAEGSRDTDGQYLTDCKPADPK